MVKSVEHDVADLALMGIIPTYPSEKYGYVVPQKDSKVTFVIGTGIYFLLLRKDRYSLEICDIVSEKFNFLPKRKR